MALLVFNSELPQIYSQSTGVIGNTVVVFGQIANPLGKLPEAPLHPPKPQVNHQPPAVKPKPKFSVVKKE